MLVKNPEKRISVKDALNYDEWLLKQAKV